MREDNRNMIKRRNFAIVFVFAITVLGLSFVNIAISPVAVAKDDYCSCDNTYSDGSTKTEKGAKTVIFGDKNGCYCGGPVNIVRIALNVLTVGIIAGGTVGIIWAGALYMLARDDESKVALAKRRLLQVVVGIAAFSVFDAAITLFTPGGAANNVPYVVSSTSTRKDLEISTPLSHPASPDNPSSPSSPSTPSTPGTADAPTVPTGNTCADYGVPAGTTYFTQFGEYGGIKWKGGSCPNCTINNSGCPMIASLNAIIKVTGCQLNPQIFADNMKAYTNDFTVRRDGMFSDNDSWSNNGANIIAHYMNDYKVHYKSIDKSGIKTALNSGHAVIALGARYDAESPKVFSKNGHYVAFVGIEGDNIYIKNPASSAYSYVSFADATAYSLSFWEVWK